MHEMNTRGRYEPLATLRKNVFRVSDCWSRKIIAIQTAD